MAVVVMLALLAVVPAGNAIADTPAEGKPHTEADVEGIGPRGAWVYCYFYCYDPFRWDWDAVGIGVTEAYCAGCWLPIQLHVTAELYYQQGGQWVKWASERANGTNPPLSAVYADATRYSYQYSGYYKTKTYHSVWYMAEPVCARNLTSNTVYLFFW